MKTGIVIPANAGIQLLHDDQGGWIPALDRNDEFSGQCLTRRTQ